MKNGILFAALFALVVMPVTALHAQQSAQEVLQEAEQKATNEEKVDYLAQEAERLLEEQQYDDAQTVVNGLLAYDPQSEEAREIQNQINDRDQGLRSTQEFEQTAAAPQVSLEEAEAEIYGKTNEDQIRDKEIISLGSVIGATVTNQNGEKLGSISDVMMSQDGQINYAVLSYAEGFLGMREKKFVVSWNNFQDSPTQEDTKILNIDKEVLEQNAGVDQRLLEETSTISRLQ